jgi:hypothetical protein
MSSPIDTFLDAYITCALWSSSDESDDTGGEPLDANYSRSDLEYTTESNMARDCERFLEENAADIGTNYEQAGHDFWLTRNGHGTGFWDRSDDVWPEEVRERLTKAAQAFGERYLVVGDDGSIYQY